MLVYTMAMRRPPANTAKTRGWLQSEVQHTRVAGQVASRHYTLHFDHGPTAGPGSLIRSSRITESWGMLPRLEHDPSWRRRLKWYSLVYIYAGRGFYHDPDGCRPIQPGSLLCLFPDRPHAYAPATGSRWDEINVDFCGPAFSPWLGPSLLDPTTPVRQLRPVGFWLSRFEQVIATVLHRDGIPTLRDTANLIELIAEMADDWQHPAACSHRDWVREVRRRLDQLQPGMELDLPVLAAEIGIGEQTLRKRFKRLTGQTPAQYRARRLISKACLLLEQTDETCRAIARQLGFESEYYFSRRFKQLIGESPSDYRQRHSTSATGI